MSLAIWWMVRVGTSPIPFGGDYFIERDTYSGDFLESVALENQIERIFIHLDHELSRRGAGKPELSRRGLGGVSPK